jgi:predicted amino acid-binding ACT domain protein
MKKAIITVVGRDTIGILAKTCAYLAKNNINILDISQTLINMRVALHSINAHPTKKGNSVTVITVSTEGVEHLKNIISRLEKIHGVYSVERLNK